jgi:hypothetical protein
MQSAVDQQGLCQLAKNCRKKPMSQLGGLSESLTANRRIRKCALRAKGHPQTGVASDAQAKKHSRKLFTLTHTACADVPKAQAADSTMPAGYISKPKLQFPAKRSRSPNQIKTYRH